MVNDPVVPGDPTGAAPDPRRSLGGSPERLVAEQLSSDAARRRRRERWRAELRTGELSVTSALLGVLGEPRTSVLLADGAELTGSVMSVGHDVVALRTAGRDWWVALEAVDAVRGEHVRAGDPEDRATLRLDEVLADLTHTTTVSIVTLGGATLDGEILAVGDGVVVADRADATIVIDPSRIARVGRRSAVRG